MSLKASCLCGGVSFSTEAKPAYSAYCHCSECRKFSGSGHSVFLGVRFDTISFHPDSEGHLGAYPKTSTTSLLFCRTCGSSLMARKADTGMAHVRLGCIDTPLPIRPMAHVHCSSAAPWDMMPADSLPRFDTAPMFKSSDALARPATPPQASDSDLNP